MTPETLMRHLSALAPATCSTADQPDLLLREVERLAEERPADRRLARLVREVARLAGAHRGLDPIVAGIRRERLLRWDADTTTWLGVDVDTGQQGLVRALRPEADEPVMRRALARDARALAEVLEGVRLDGAAIAAPAPGAPFEVPVDGHVRAARVLGALLADLSRWQRLGLGLPALTPEEVRIDDAGGRVVCLSPVEGPDFGDTLSWLADRLELDDESALARLVSGLRQLPPYDAAEAVESLLGALAEDLAAERHALAYRSHRIRHADRVARLDRLVQRLSAAAPPPEGRGAVGVDLDGRITVVESADGIVVWGPDGEEDVVYSPYDGLDAPLARRMLRSRAAAPPNPRLDAEIDGDPRVTDAIGRWTSAALRLRTVALLLRNEVAALAALPA